MFQAIMPLLAAMLALGLRETNPRFAGNAVAQIA